MSYKLSVQEQKKFSYEFLDENLKLIEKNFTDSTSKYFTGKTIYVLLPGIYETNYFVKTTVSDIKSVEGKIDINWLCMLNDYSNLQLFCLKEPRKREFAGDVKFTPRNSLSFSSYGFCFDKNGDAEVCVTNKSIPILQNEKFLIEACDNAFNTNEEDVDYDEIMRDSIINLIQDDRFSNVKKNQRCNPNKAVENEIKQKIQEMLCTYYDIENSWGITYVWKGILFIIPLKREYFKDILKDRDKEGGRRRVLPTIVKSHTRNGGHNVDSHLRSCNGVKIDNREFGFLIGAEDYEKIFPKTEKSRKRAMRMIKNSDVEGKFIIQRK